MGVVWDKRKPLLPAPADEARTELRRWQRFRNRLKNFGLKDALSFSVKALIRKPLSYNEDWVYVLDLKQKTDQQPQVPKEISVWWLRKADFERDDSLMGQVLACSLLADAGEVQECLENGDACLTFFEGKNLIHSGWLRQNNLPGFAERKGEKNAYRFGGMTEKAYRRRGLEQLSFRLSQHEMAREGCDYLFGSPGFDNAVSRHCLQKVGFVPIRVLYSIRVFGKALRWQRKK